MARCGLLLGDGLTVWGPVYSRGHLSDCAFLCVPEGVTGGVEVCCVCECVCASMCAGGGVCVLVG